MLRNSLTLDDSIFSKQKKIMVIGCLLYIIMPLDILPDIPPLGYIDDIAVLLYVVSQIKPYLTATIESSSNKINSFAEKKVADLINNTFEKIYPRLNKTLKRSLWGLIISMTYTLILRILRFVFSYNNTFGEIGTYYVVNTIKFVSLTYWLVYTIIFFVKYGDIAIPLTQNIIRSITVAKNVSIGIDIGIATFVTSNYPILDKFLGGINKSKKYIPGFSVIPDLPDIVKAIRIHIIKEFKAFFIFIGLIIATRIIFIFK